MLDIKRLQQSLASLVGWRNEPDYTLSETLQNSESGLYYQSAHPLLTLANISSMLADNATLEDYLQIAVSDAIAEMATKIVSGNTISGASKQLLEHKTLFDAIGRINNRIPTRRQLVGYEIQPLKGEGITTLIHRIGTQFIGGNGQLTIYLFHSSQQQPLKTLQITLSDAQKSYVWHNLTDAWQMPYNGENTATGGAWYIVYDQQALPTGTEAINISKDWSKEPCGGCNVGSIETWRALTKYLRISPFCVTVDEDWSTTPTLFDISDIIYTPTMCYGINLELSIGCDPTNFLIKQRHLLATTLQLQVATNILRRIAYNPDVTVNRNQLNAQRADIISELDGNTLTRSAGLSNTLKKAYEAISIDISGLDSTCLACKRKGVRYGVA